MDVQQPFVKVYASRSDLPIRELIPIFHAWIQKSRTGDLLVDVHDYSHVHHGPGIILVGHECQYGLDQGEGRSGLLYRRRRGDPEPASSALRGAVDKALAACSFLEVDSGGKLAFDRNELRVGFDDRLRAPNDPATFAALRPDLDALAGSLWGSGSIEQVGDPRAPFAARLRKAA